MALNMLLKIEEIDGKANSAENVYKIDLRSWRWGASNSGAAAPNIQDLCVTKYIDNTSTALFAACFRGSRIDSAVLSIHEGREASPVEYFQVKVQNAFISSIFAGGPDSDGRMTEEITINFSKVNLDYTLRGSEGAPETAVPFGWDIAANAEA
jgi:type VI secretion system secreted protein Hcp